MSIAVAQVLSKGGFWRRVLALVLDALMVLVPLQILVAVLFAATGGGVQGSFGIVSTNCQQSTELPAGLDPPPPDGFNYVVECRASLFGFDTSRTLIAGKQTVDGAVTTNVFQSYALDAAGNPRPGAFHADLLAIIACFAWMVGFAAVRGATPGKRVLAMCIIQHAEPDRPGLGFGRSLGREAAKWLGALPSLGVFLWLSGWGSDADSLTQAMQSGTSLAVLAAAGIINLVWMMWIVISIVRRRDTIYDRIAGTAVIRT